MAAFKTHVKALEDRFETLWVHTPIVWQNQPGADTPPVDGSSFVRFQVNIGGTQAMVIGAGASGGTAKRLRTEGTIFVQLVSPLGVGVLNMHDLADKVAAVFDQQDFGGITCRETTPSAIRRDGEAFVANVSCPFFYDET